MGRPGWGGIGLGKHSRTPLPGPPERGWEPALGRSFLKPVADPAPPRRAEQLRSARTWPGQTRPQPRAPSGEGAAPLPPPGELGAGSRAARRDSGPDAPCSPAGFLGEAGANARSKSVQLAAGRHDNSSRHFLPRSSLLPVFPSSKAGGWCRSVCPLCSLSAGLGSEGLGSTCPWLCPALQPGVSLRILRPRRRTWLRYRPGGRVPAQLATASTCSSVQT